MKKLGWILVFIVVLVLIWLGFSYQKVEQSAIEIDTPIFVCESNSFKACSIDSQGRCNCVFETYEVEGKPEKG